MKHKPHAGRAKEKIHNLTCENIRLKAEILRLQEELAELKMSILLREKSYEDPEND